MSPSGSAMIDARQRTVSYVDAGHGYALLVREDGTIDSLAADEGLPVGVDEEATYAARTISLPAAGHAVIVSDGIVEQFGTPGRRHRTGPVRDRRRPPSSFAIGPSPRPGRPALRGRLRPRRQSILGRRRHRRPAPLVRLAETPPKPHPKLHPNYPRAVPSLSPSYTQPHTPQLAEYSISLLQENLYAKQSPKNPRNSEGLALAAAELGWA